MMKIVAMLLVLAAAAFGDDSRLESSPLLPVMAVESVGATGESTDDIFSDQFWLGRSVNFGAEVIMDSGTAEYTGIIQMYGSDEAWHDDPDGAFVTGSTAEWNHYELTLTYWNRPLRVKITNLDAAEAEYSIFLHRDRGLRQ
jgi:hypothetical protein